MSPRPDEPDNFDALLDTALNTYTDTAPRLGLERRILNQIASSQSKPIGQRRIWLVRLACLTAAIALAAVLIYPLTRVSLVYHRRDARTLSNAQAENQSAPNAAIRASPLKPAPAHARRRGIAHSAPPDTNLASVQLSGQAMLLAHFVAIHPKLALSLASSQSQLDQPLNLPDISIQRIQLQTIAQRAIVIPPLGDDPLPPVAPTNL